MIELILKKYIQDYAKTLNVNDVREAFYEKTNLAKEILIPENESNLKIAKSLLSKLNHSKILTPEIILGWIDEVNPKIVKEIKSSKVGYDYFMKQFENVVKLLI